MKFNNLKLGQKLGVAFASILFIMLFIGILAIINMSRISSKSKVLVNEYQQEVEIANNIERNFLQTMYYIRSYGYTGEEELLTKALSFLNETKKYMDNADDLVDETENLETLKLALESVNTDFKKYQELIDKTEANVIAIDNARTNMDEAADEFIDNCEYFISNQNAELGLELQSGAKGEKINDRITKINYMNSVVDKGNELRIANFKAQANLNHENLKNAIDKFDLDPYFEVIRPLTKQQSNIMQLEKIEDCAEDYLKEMNIFYEAWISNEKIQEQRITLAIGILDKLQKAADDGITESSNTGKEVITLIYSSNIILIISLLVAIALGFVLAFYMTRILVAGLSEGVKIAENIAEGNLTTEISRELVEQKDEIGDMARALQKMSNKLKSIVENIIMGAENISSASQEIASTSQEMSQGASQQASSTEEVTSSMEEISANIQQNTENARLTQQIAQKSLSGIITGNKATQESVDAMKMIAEKIRIINDIAFQTNILALNAAVEAARAGELGKGFAVVAAEVRKLAERSAKAANEIDSVSKNGVSIAENAGNLLNKILPEIEKTATLVQEISAASTEQNAGASQVNSAINQLNQVTQQNAAAAEQLATSAEQLAGQAEQLTDTMSFFKIGHRNISHAKKNINHKRKTSQLKKTIYSDNNQDDDEMDNKFEKF